MQEGKPDDPDNQAAILQQLVNLLTAAERIHVQGASVDPGPTERRSASQEIIDDSPMSPACRTHFDLTLTLCHFFIPVKDTNILL